MTVVTAATADDLAALPEIERQARAILYGMAGLGAVAQLAPVTLERLRRGPCWVARRQERPIVGFILVDKLANHVVLESLAILPEFSGAGVGRALVGAATSWASDAGVASLLVMAYRDIPWDAPFYARLGFEEMPRRLWTTDMHRLSREAILAGHDGERRLWMRLPLG